MREFQNSDVEQKFLSYPEPQRQKLLEIRELIFNVAENDNRIGILTETLKWGEPSYVTEQTISGSTVRLGLFPKNKIAILFHCKTTLVESFREIYGDKFEYSKNRAILLNSHDRYNKDILSHCIFMSLTYKLQKK
ncbi:MAG: DUF1801 domain-containing protein [Alphaproteobacteria bacterium]|nr:DUF1801 domain-containing protein [Alphaproteobacteria bacterium]